MSLLFDGVGAPALLLISIFLAVTAVLWLLLPFSIFGIKAKLDEQLRVLRSLDRNIEHLQRTLAEQAREARRPPPPETPVPQDGAEVTPPTNDWGEEQRADEPHVTEPPHRDSVERWQKPGAL
jgi:hypothetical protein